MGYAAILAGGASSPTPRPVDTSAYGSHPAPNVDPILVSATGSSPTWGSWSEVIAAGAINEDIVVYHHSLHASGSNFWMPDVSFGLGGAGSEVECCRIAAAGVVGSQTAEAAFRRGIQMYGNSFRVPAGTRLAVRTRSATGVSSGVTERLTISYVKLPAAYSRGIASESWAATLTGPTPGTFTAWTQLIATSAITTKFWIYGLFLGAGGGASAHVGGTVEVGVGGAGAEVVQGRFRLASGSDSSGSAYYGGLWLPRPIEVAANSRVALRWTYSSTTNENISSVAAPIARLIVADNIP